MGRALRQHIVLRTSYYELLGCSGYVFESTYYVQAYLVLDFVNYAISMLHANQIGSRWVVRSQWTVVTCNA